MARTVNGRTEAEIVREIRKEERRIAAAQAALQKASGRRNELIGDLIDVTGNPGIAAEVLGIVRQRLYQLKTADGTPIMRRSGTS